MLKMKNLLLLTFLNLVFTAGAQTPAKRDSAHIMRKDPKQVNPYAYADSVKVKKPAIKPKK